jgi:hypothetical protein
MSISNSAYIIYGFKLPDDDEFERIYECCPDTYIRKNKLKYVKVHMSGCDDNNTNFIGVVVEELEDFTRSSNPYKAISHKLLEKISDKRYQAVNEAADLMKISPTFYMIGTSF